MSGLEIIALNGREVLDSRGNPTLEVEVCLAGGVVERAMVPSGASTGKHEAHEMRDCDERRYQGKGVRQAVESVHGELFPILRGMRVTAQRELDFAMIELDGSENKSRLGANAILAVSLALAKAGASALGLPLFQYVGGVHAHRLPVPMLNMLNGGVHADNSLDIQEFMVMPIGARSFTEAMEMSHAITHGLRVYLKKSGLSTNVGDEGGFAPDLADSESALDALLEAIHAAGLKAGHDVSLALDCAASEYYRDGVYDMQGSGQQWDVAGHVGYLSKLCADYPIISIEDGMAEDDWAGWLVLTEALGDKVQLVGDDLFVTHPDRLRRGVEEGIGNALLVKVNQVGTLSEACAAIEIAHRGRFSCVMSHRSGETEDAMISDLSVALNCGQIKAGALSRGERTAKYNQLLRIEETLGSAGIYGL